MRVTDFAHEWKTAFRTPLSAFEYQVSAFEYQVVPFGLTNAPAFQSYVNQTLHATRISGRVRDSLHGTICLFILSERRITKGTFVWSSSFS